MCEYLFDFDVVFDFWCEFGCVVEFCDDCGWFVV